MPRLRSVAMRLQAPRRDQPRWRDRVSRLRVSQKLRKASDAGICLAALTPDLRRAQRNLFRPAPVSPGIARSQALDLGRSDRRPQGDVTYARSEAALNARCSTGDGRMPIRDVPGACRDFIWSRRAAPASRGWQKARLSG